MSQAALYFIIIFFLVSNGPYN